MELKRALHEIICRHLPAPIERDLGDTDDLAALGVDSLRFVNILAELDRELQIEVPDELMTFENFSTLGAAYTTILALRSR